MLRPLIKFIVFSPYTFVEAYVGYLIYAWLVFPTTNYQIPYLAMLGLFFTIGLMSNWGGPADIDVLLKESQENDNVTSLARILFKYLYLIVLLAIAFVIKTIWL